MPVAGQHRPSRIKKRRGPLRPVMLRVEVKSAGPPNGFFRAPWTRCRLDLPSGKEMWRVPSRAPANVRSSSRVHGFLIRLPYSFASAKFVGKRLRRRVAAHDRTYLRGQDSSGSLWPGDSLRPYLKRVREEVHMSDAWCSYRMPMPDERPHEVVGNNAAARATTTGVQHCREARCCKPAPQGRF